MQDTWDKVESYYDNLFIKESADLKLAEDNSIEAKLFPIAVSPSQGKFLYMLALMRQAKRILEVGTLGGYSAIWMAKALPADGQLITLEKRKYCVKVARENIEQSEDARNKVKIIEGDALVSLSQLYAQSTPAFDMIFIDANKADFPQYFTAALHLAKKGTLIIADNVIRNGDVVNNIDDPAIKGIQAMNELIADEPRVTAVNLPTVGSKGYDGMTIMLVDVGV